VPASARYQPFYCEENVYHLCHDPRLADRDPAALFIRGGPDGCLMWHQRSAPRRGEPILWDYHVVLLARGPWEIWDLDTTLACPIAAASYLLRSFRPKLAIPAAYAPRFRLIGASELAATFASDRSHMRRADGQWSEPPPPWPPIGRAGLPDTLARYLDMDDPIAGERLDLATLLARVQAR
jgi:hypothetical protein